MARSSHFMVSPETCVEDMFRGVAVSFPSLTVDNKSGIILYTQENEDTQRKVGLLSGGGSGHEPFTAGYVGEGMLTGAVAGKIFTSPPPTNILAAICNVAKVSPGGVLLVYNNYTGDCLNFGLAMEKAKLRGLKVKSITIDEDCAIDAPRGAGKRGLCGCLFVFKIAGGMAALGRDLDDIYDECLLVKQNIATFGVTLKPCNMPGTGPMFEIEEGFLELGIGMHGEAGASKSKMAAADEIASALLDKLCKNLNVKANNEVCVIINNLGGSSQLEQYIMAGIVHEELRKRNIGVKRLYTGTLMTSLDMSGVQVSLLLLPRENDSHRQLWLKTLDSYTNAFAWPATSLSRHPPQQMEVFDVLDSDTQDLGPQISDQQAKTLKRCLKAAAEAFVKNEETLNELDRGCGDGDTGSTFRCIAHAILQDINNLPVKFPQQCFMQLSKMAEDVMGGTSGALYSLMFIGASEKVPDWAAAWQAALVTAMTYSKATLGGRTMFDALIPACDAFNTTTDSWSEALRQAVCAAEEGCQWTVNYQPLFGRASYVAANHIKSVDAGAYAVTVWLKAVQDQLLDSVEYCQ